MFNDEELAAYLKTLSLDDFRRAQKVVRAEHLSRSSRGESARTRTILSRLKNGDPPKKVAEDEGVSRQWVYYLRTKHNVMG